MRIMIVDDEVIIRTGLAKVINWNDLGLELLEPAASAEEALERIPQEKPHILLTDIQMTGKSGLQLAEEASLILPELEIIILSGYDDFVYTQQAIRQNISDYILKTSRPEEIMNTVLKAKQRAEERWANHSQNVISKSDEKDHMFQRYVIDGESIPLDKPNQLLFLSHLQKQQEYGNTCMQVVIIVAEGWDHARDANSLLVYAVQNMLHELLTCVTLIQKNRIVVVTPSEQWSGDFQPDQFICHKIERLLKCTLYAAAGVSVTDVQELHESYSSADYATGYQSFLPKKSWSYEEIKQRTGGKTICTREEEQRLAVILLDNDVVALKNWVQQYIQELMDDPQLTLQSLAAAIQSVTIVSQRWLDRLLKITGRENILKDYSVQLQASMNNVSKDELFQQLYNIMRMYHTDIAEGQAAHINKARAFIEVHLEQDVSLQRVAKHIHVHPNHLSDVFKKETGITFGDFVTRIKMQRAMEVLAGSPAKISEVAAQVGYSDVKYFSKIFKKHTGKTPSEFRGSAPCESL